MWLYSTLAFVTFAVVNALPTSTYTRRIEKKLYDDIRDGYEPLERPVVNSSEPVIVKLALTLNQIIDVNEKDQIITLNAWLQYTWTDVNAKWNPEEYGGILDLRFPFGTLWKPDVLLYNSVDSSFDSTYPTNMVLYSDGTVNWIPPGIFQISCKINIEWFPFDEQRCYFKFGSWTFDGTKIDLQPDPRGWDLSEYMVNGEWNLYHTHVERSEKFYECCPEPYPSLHFWMYMKRRTLYYGFNLIIPCILITLITILGFILPPDSGEKIGLQITVMLAISMFLDIVAQMSPPTSEAVPLLGAFFSTCMMVVSASVVMTVIALNFHHRSAETHQMGDTTRAVLLEWVPWMLFMVRPGKKERRMLDLPMPEFIRNSLRQSKQGKNRETADSTRSLLDEECGILDDSDADSNLEHRVNKCLSQLAADSTTTMDTGQQAQLMLLHRLFTEIRYITNRMAEEDADGDKQNDWKFAAMVIDRLCLYLFSFFILISTCYIFFTAPYLTA